MKKSVQISIPSPCHENWQNMTLVKKGRFCSACQKNVIDFTHATDREILAALKNDSNLCGRFKTAQLDRDLLAPKEKSSVWIAAASGVFAFLGIGGDTVSAQQQNLEQTDSKINDDTAKSSEPTLFSGTVYDQDGIALPAVKIEAKNGGIVTLTDLDGNFQIKGTAGDVISISYPGLETTEIVLTKLSDVKIALLKTDTVESMVTVGWVKRRTFFGRIFHSIGNLFRRKH